MVDCRSHITVVCLKYPKPYGPAFHSGGIHRFPVGGDDERKPELSGSCLFKGCRQLGIYVKLSVAYTIEVLDRYLLDEYICISRGDLGTGLSFYYLQGRFNLLDGKVEDVLQKSNGKLNGTACAGHTEIPVAGDIAIGVE